MSPIKGALRLFALIHLLMAALFAVAAVMLIVMSSHMAWAAFAGGLDKHAAQQVIEARRTIIGFPLHAGG